MILFCLNDLSKALHPNFDLQSQGHVTRSNCKTSSNQQNILKIKTVFAHNDLHAERE